MPSARILPFNNSDWLYTVRSATMYFSRLITLALLFSSGVCGRDSWLRMRSEHFDLITDFDAGASRQVLRWLEEIGQVLPLEPHENAPRVFVFRSEATF